MPTSSRRTRSRPARGDAVAVEGGASDSAAAVPDAAASGTSDITALEVFSDSDDTREKTSKKSPGTKTTEKTKRSKKSIAGKNDKSSSNTKSSTATASSAALSAILPRSVSEDPSSLLCHLLVHVQSLADSKKRCTEALRALKDGRNVASPFVLEEDESEEGGKSDAAAMKEEVSAAAAPATAAATNTTVAPAAVAAPGSPRGKKRTRSADKKKKRGAASLEALSFEGDMNVDGNTINNNDDNSNKNVVDVSNTQRIRDAHLIMAATQAINVLISYLKDSKTTETGENAKHAALVLAALSHHLVTSLLNDKSMLESITKSSQNSASHSYSTGVSSLGSRLWGGIAEDDAVMEGNDDSAMGTSRGHGRGSGARAATLASMTEQAVQQKLERKRKMIVSYAKAVAGRALTSCVMGALYAMETLGDLSFEDDVSMVREEEGGERKLEYNLLRRGVWTCLLALETAFQFNNRPKFLMTSSVSNCSLGSSSSGGMAGSSYTSGMLDFDGVMSPSVGGCNASSAVATGNSSGARSIVHTHMMMGNDTISMWNRFVQRIMLDYKLGFHLQNEIEISNENFGAENELLSRICRATTGNVFSSEDDSKFISLVLKSEMGNPALRSLIDEPPKKKAKRTPKTKGKPTENESLDEELHELSALLAKRHENHVLFDCHVSVRRWSTLAFGWLCSGQRRFLETCMTMLTRKEGWKTVLEMTPVTTKKPTVIALDVEENPPSKKKKKDSKIKRSSISKDAALLSPNQQMNGLPGDLALVVFISCMVDLISTGGISPSNSGWMDDYVKAIIDTPDPFASSNFVAPETANETNFSPEKNEESHVRRSARTRSKVATAKATERAAAEASRTSPKGVKKSIAAWVRPNITDEVAFLTKLLIDAHVSCLQDTFRQYLRTRDSSSSPEIMDSDKKRLLVNDDDSYRDSLSTRRDDSIDLVNKIPFYPFMHLTLDTLSRTASSSTFVSSSGVKSRILAIGGAIALSRFVSDFEALKDEDGAVVLDAKLISLAVSQLSETFDSFSRKNDSASNERASRENCDEKTTIDLLTNYRLNEPLVIERVEKKDSDSDPRAIDAAVSYAGAFAPGREDLASHAEVLSCYIRAQLNPPYTDNVYRLGMISFLDSLLSVVRMCYDFPTEKQIEVSDTKRPPVKKKKRKTDYVSVLSTTGPHDTSAKTVTRCVLAADTLNFLRMCLAISPEREDSSSPKKEAEVLWIRSFFRKVVSTKFINKLVDLGYLLQDKLIYPRLLHKMNDKMSSIPESSKVLFESCERRLWSSHIKLSLTIGRGQAAYTGQSGESLLHESERRFEVFSHIAKVEEERYQLTPNRLPVLLSRHYWPLFLPALQHSLVSSTLSCVPAQPESSVQAEWFICDAFLNSFELVARHPEWRSGEDLADLEPPISLRDARLFILAAGKLDRDRQKAVFIRLIELLHNGLVLSTARLPLHVHTIRLFARGVCLASHLTDLVTSHGLDTSLSREVASSHYNMPKIVKSRTPEEERSCCNKDIAFMGLFDDCKSPSVPVTGILSGEMLEEMQFEKMNELVKSSLELGFKVCGQDGGYLLFSSWNSAAKLCSWTPMCWEGPSTAAMIKKQGVIDRLMNLRDDMCEVYQLINKHESSPHQQTLLARATLSKKGHCRPNEALLTGITSCEKMIGHLASELNCAQMSPEVPSLQTFAYLEALPVYVSFLISMHTRPQSNTFSSIHRFSKSQPKRSKPITGYTDNDVVDEFLSDDSDSETPDTEGQSLKTRAIGRLHNACVSLGAAPCWPDWLDVGCQMQSEMVPPVAVDSADRALSSLTNFGIVVFKRYCQALQGALDVASLSSLRESSPISSQLVHQLLVCHQVPLSGPEHESFYSHLSSISQIEVPRLKFVISNKSCLPCNSFSTHSSQRVKGVDTFIGPEPIIAELRANEHWEMILSCAIQGSTLQILSPSSPSDDSSSLVRALEVASRWKRVLDSVVSAMVPTAALLRFAVYDAKGRSPHPLCGDLPENAISSETTETSRFSTNNEVGLNMKRALSFLSLVSTFSNEEDPLRLTCQAAANHMLESTAQVHFNAMVALWTVRVSSDAIQGLLEMLKTEDVSESRSMAALALIEAILKQICTTQNNASVPEDDSGQPKALNTLLASFGEQGILQTRLIGDQAKVELAKIISSENSYCPVATQRIDLAKLFLFLLVGKDQNTQGLRSLVAETFCNLIDHEAKMHEESEGCNGALRLAAATALDEMSRDDVLLLTECIFQTSAPKEKELTERLVKVLSTLATVEHKSISGKGCNTILSAMTECMSQWACSCVQSSATNLICILASRFGTLQQIGSSILSLAMSEDDNSNLTHCIQAFFQFMLELEQAVHPGLAQEPASKVASQKEQNVPKKGTQRRTCTFTQTGEGFADQHWYNCYTCELLWDKGCCSLCAKVCHKGHDVGYSRKSSFFCDCGAGVASGTMLKCKCLKPIDDKAFHALQDESDVMEKSIPQEFINPAKMVFKSFPAECIESLQLLVKEAKVSMWNETILDLLKRSFTSKTRTFDFSTFFRDPPVISFHDDGKPSLDLRCGAPLNLKGLGDIPSLLPTRAAKANSLKIGVLPSLSTSQPRRTCAERHFIDADMRGRMVCAESNSILFFNAIPLVNIRNVECPHSSHLSRSQLCLLGSEKVKFDHIHGLALSPEGQKLVVWGASETFVGLLSKGFDSFERTISLSLQLEAEPSECETEYLLGLLWLTETILVGICGTFVHVFDLATANSNDSCKATAHYALAYEDVLIRSAVLTSNLSCSNEVHKKLAILLDSGRLHFIDLYVDNFGTLEEEGETYIEVGSGITFPSAGIRRYSGGEPASAGSTSTTFGEGSTLHFLTQSNLLIYQCVSSPCVAMLIDKTGSISGTFELLPSTISSDNLPGSELGAVSGPYLHFQEMGTVRRGGEIFYRVTCIGRSTASNHPRILLVEFNQFSVFVQELIWPPNSSPGLGNMSSNSIVGSCTFSIPYLIGGTAEHGSIDSHTEVYERAFVTMLSSSGSILWFGEDCDGLAPKEADLQKKVGTSPDIFMFEDPSIINVTESLAFAGDCAGKDSKTTKKKLSLNNSEFLMSPSRDGCTLTARLESDRAKKGSNDVNIDNLAIVAVRVLVGSMPDLIPREISIMGSGRTIKTRRNMKRWYDFVLTDEEILLSVRNGCISINFSSSQDLSSGAIVDAVEIYAKNRSELHFLMPNSESSLAPKNDYNFQWHDKYEQEKQCHISYIQSLLFLAKVLGEDTTSFLSSGGRDVVQQILETTAFDSSEPTGDTLRSSTLNLLKEVEHDESERTLFIDKCTLCGLMAALMSLGSFMKTGLSSASASIPFPRQETIIHHVVDMLVHIITKSADIAKTNGANYKAAIFSLIKDGALKGSLGIESKKILDYAGHLSLLFGSPVSFVRATYYMSDLILKEIACTDSNEFAHFDSLSEYMLHEDSSIVEACCKAIISNAMDTPKPKVSSEEKSTQDNPNGYVTYQCDACKIFPIKDMRYTIGGEVDIDLCKDCFERGCTYAASNEPGTPLVIHGRTLCVEGEDMPCDSIWQMKGITIAPPTAGFPVVEDVEAALKMSQTTKHYTACVGVVDREEFRTKIFSSLLHSLSRSFGSKDSIPSHHLIQLVLVVIHGSRSEKLRIERGHEMLKTITDSLRGLLDAHVVNTGKIVLCLRTLSSLVMKKTSIDQAPSLPFVKSARDTEKDARSYHHKDKTDPRFICDAHKVPAVRRRCSHGVHKDRRFYVCGLERKQRCNYFKWADMPNDNSSDKQLDLEDQQSPNTDDSNHVIFEPIRNELTKMLGERNEGSSSIQLQFCDLISKQFEMLKDSSAETDLKESGVVSAVKLKLVSRNTEDLKRETRDGVLKSRKKLGKTGHLSTVKSSHTQSESSSDPVSLISESLFLFSLMASSQKWGSDWFPVLCAIISTGGSSALRQLAKKFLQQLCGGRQDVYHRVRDHYVYGYQFRKLLVQSAGVLGNALIAREMAKQCGVNWREDEVNFATLPSSGLLGVGDLISEDCYSVSYEQNVELILDELLSTASTHARRGNWRNFCALSELPADASEKTATRGRVSEISILEQLVHRPPIMSVLWLSSCLRGSNQVKMLKLADIALTDRKTEDTSSSTDEDDVRIGEGMPHDCGQISPEQRLSNLTVGDVHAFIVEFIVNGKNEELRYVAGNVVTKLASRFSDAEKLALFSKLVCGLFRNVVGKFGSASKEFIELLKYFIQNFGLDLYQIAACITSSFVLQMTTANHNGPKRFWPSDKEITPFNLANCVHCHRQCTKQSSNELGVSKGHEVWIDEQLRPCVKSRLESSTLASASSEYSSYVQLKFRVVLSEVYVTVSDPRGRLVKNIGVYFSPRPFGDVNMLKNDVCGCVWQRCGTLSLGRHATSASFKLKTPVVAANLKFTYEDFYEKVGAGGRAPDGSFVLHCPRCTRQVNNAHGVCGNCGEVAFQCRKCRHINYDRLDAFLCVECGYCTSGGFSYDVSIGMALNAVAILDEDGYQRSISMLKIASKRHSELMNSLKKKMFVFSQQQSKLNGLDERIEEMVLYGPHLKRAFLGRLPKMNDESEAKPGSSSQSSSVSNRQGESNRSLVANRARSLISLARQFRAEGTALGGDNERLSRSEFLIQQALLSSGSAGASDVLDELSETVFGALASGSSADNALDRAMASLQERSPARTSRTEGVASLAEGSSRVDSKDDKKPLTIEECYRIYSQMREAERECYELTRRIEAWNRLNRDSLATTGPRSPLNGPFTFQPTLCYACSPQMTLSLTSLLSAVFETNVSQWEHTVSNDLIKLLLTESEHMNNELKNMKRQAVITLASTSEAASEFILKEIKTRLTAAQDMTSAEVLGQIVQLDFPSVEKYIDLAISVLQENAV